MVVNILIMSKPAEFEMLVDALRSLPGVGVKNAKRWAFFLLKQDERYINDFTKRIINAKERIKRCVSCANLSTNQYCEICLNEYRDRSKLMIVSTVEELEKIEESNIYQGLYHVTEGEISLRKSVMVEHTNLKTLKQRVVDNNFSEVIIATSFTHDGLATSEYVHHLLKDLENVRIYRIAFGIPSNSSINYADDETIKYAINNKSMMKGV